MADSNSSCVSDLIADLATISCPQLLNMHRMTKTLKKLTLLNKLEENRQVLTSSHWETLTEIATFVYVRLQKQTLAPEELDFIAEFFRCLRNSCVGCCEDERCFMSFKELCEVALKILVQLLKNQESEKEIVVLRCCLQLFGNLVCRSNQCKVIVWNVFEAEKLFWILLKHNDLKVKEYSMMILYNCTSSESLCQMINTNAGQEFLIVLTGALCNNLEHWGILLMERVVNAEEFMEKCYKIFPIMNKLLVLDVIAELLDDKRTCFSVPNSNLKYIKQRFTECAMDIVKTCNSDTIIDLEPVEIVKLLSFLCSASVTDGLSEELKSYKDLLEVSLDTLKSVHILGKTTFNSFSPLKNLKEASNISKEEIEEHPSYCFKNNLVRLIGNLCSECQENQDLVRNLDGIPLLLECCNLDVRNPFIMQWGILAMRNLLENNPKNQAVVSSITITENVVNSKLLNELGFEVKMDNGRPVLKRSSHLTSFDK